MDNIILTLSVKQDMIIYSYCKPITSNGIMLTVSTTRLWINYLRPCIYTKLSVEIHGHTARKQWAPYQRTLIFPAPNTLVTLWDYHHEVMRAPSKCWFQRQNLLRDNYYQSEGYMLLHAETCIYRCLPLFLTAITKGELLVLEARETNQYWAELSDVVQTGKYCRVTQGAGAGGGGYIIGVKGRT